MNLVRLVRCVNRRGGCDPSRIKTTAAGRAAREKRGHCDSKKEQPRNSESCTRGTRLLIYGDNEADDAGNQRDAQNPETPLNARRLIGCDQVRRHCFANRPEMLGRLLGARH